MKLCIRNSVKKCSFVISLIIKYLSDFNSEAKTDIYATECRIHKSVIASECRIHGCWHQLRRNYTHR